MDEEPYRQVLEDHASAGHHPVRASVLLLIAVIALALLYGYDRTPNWIGFLKERFSDHYE